MMHYQADLPASYCTSGSDDGLASTYGDSSVGDQQLEQHVEAVVGTLSRVTDSVAEVLKSLHLVTAQLDVIANKLCSRCALTDDDPFEGASRSTDGGQSAELSAEPSERAQAAGDAEGGEAAPTAPGTLPRPPRAPAAGCAAFKSASTQGLDEAHELDWDASGLELSQGDFGEPCLGEMLRSGACVAAQRLTHSRTSPAFSSYGAPSGQHSWTDISGVNEFKLFLQSLSDHDWTEGKSSKHAPRLITAPLYGSPYEKQMEYLLEHAQQAAEASDEDEANNGAENPRDGSIQSSRSGRDAEPAADAQGNSILGGGAREASYDRTLNTWQTFTLPHHDDGSEGTHTPKADSSAVNTPEISRSAARKSQVVPVGPTAARSRVSSSAGRVTIGGESSACLAASSGLHEKRRVRMSERQPVFV